VQILIFNIQKGELKKAFMKSSTMQRLEDERFHNNANFYQKDMIEYVREWYEYIDQYSDDDNGDYENYKE